MADDKRTLSLARVAWDWLVADVPLGTAAKDVAGMTGVAVAAPSTIPAWTVLASVIGVGYVVGSVAQAVSPPPKRDL